MPLGRHKKIRKFNFIEHISLYSVFDVTLREGKEILLEASKEVGLEIHAERSRSISMSMSMSRRQNPGPLRPSEQWQS